MSSFKTCEFSEALEQNGGLVQFSPLCATSPENPAYIAAASGNRLIIRDAQSLQSLYSFSCIDKIDRMEWSPDGLYVACLLLMRAAVQVFSVADAQWRCRINEGVAGLVSAKWSPDSRHIILESDFGIQLSVWSLMAGTSQLIMHPKPNTFSNSASSSMIAFSPCGRFLAVGLRIELQDFIGVYGINTVEWSELAKFKCKAGGNNLSSICWAPDGSHIIAADSHLSYKLVVYTPSGEVVAAFEAYQNALGIKQVLTQARSISSSVTPQSLPPIESVVAVGSFDGIVRILSPLSWKLAFELPLTHPKDMQPGLTEKVSSSVQFGKSIVVTTVEVAESAGAESLHSTLKSTGSSCYVSRNLKTLPRVNPDPNAKGSPKFGVSGLSSSPDCLFLAAREESFPRCLWIWDMSLIKLSALIVNLDNILAARWSPSKASLYPLLAFCSGSPRVYFWCPSPLEEPSAIGTVENDSIESSTFWADLPRENSFPVLNIKWSSDGLKLILCGRDNFCVCEVQFSETSTKPTVRLDA